MQSFTEKEMNTDDYMILVKSIETLFALVITWNIFKAIFTE
jgi:hypothetical protein